MEPTSFTVDKLPIEAYEAYAATQSVWERQVDQGMVSRTGALELHFAHQVRILNQTLLIPHLFQLLGIHVKTTIARFPTLKAAQERRDFGGLGTNSLGSDQEREAAIERIRELGGTASEDGQKLIAALQLTLKDRQMRRHIQSTMSGLCAA